MDFFFLILEALVWVIDLTAMVADVYSWMRGKDNRLQRKLARQTGTSIPPRDRWNRRVIGLTITVVIATAALVLWNR